MGSFAGLWAGFIYGTNTGKVFLDLSVEKGVLTGIARLNDDSFGVIVYSVSGADGDKVDLECTPQRVPEGVEAEAVRVEGKLAPDGTIGGKWETDSGTGGTFKLFPHAVDLDQQTSKPTKPEQIYNRILTLGSVRLYRDDVSRIIEMVRKDFTLKGLIVTYEHQGNEIIRFADDFLKEIDQIHQLQSLKLFMQESGGGSVNRVVNLDLLESGESTVRVSGPDETWVMGKAESVRKAMSAYENSIITNYRKYGLNVNSLLFLIMLILTPSIVGVWRRFIFVAVVVVLLLVLFAIHSKLIPNTLVLIKAKPRGPLALAWPSILSWLLAVTSSLVAALIFWLLTK